MARHATALLLSGRSAEARTIAGRVFATGYRRLPFVELCAKHGLAPGESAVMSPRGIRRRAA